jgi:hypothetical protein
VFVDTGRDVELLAADRGRAAVSFIATQMHNCGRSIHSTWLSKMTLDTGDRPKMASSFDVPSAEGCGARCPISI